MELHELPETKKMETRDKVASRTLQHKNQKKDCSPLLLFEPRYLVLLKDVPILTKTHGICRAHLETFNLLLFCQIN